MHPRRKHSPVPDFYEAFWRASRNGRDLFGLASEAASDEKTVENWVDFDYLEDVYTREEARLILRDIFEKAHRILMHEPPMKPEAQACFRELAFWNTVRILADYSVEDMAKLPEHAARAKHADAIWPSGMMVRIAGEEEFKPARELLQANHGYTNWGVG